MMTPAMLKQVIEEMLSHAGAARAAGVTRLEIAGVGSMVLAPAAVADPPLPPGFRRVDEDDDGSQPRDVLHDPATHGIPPSSSGSPVPRRSRTPI